MITAMEFINRETLIWGEDYVDSLINRNYLPMLTSAGWKWILCDESIDYTEYIDNLMENPQHSST